MPVLKAPVSAVAVWGSESPLYQDTVWPALTVAGFGEYELLPFMPATVIVTSAVVGAGVFPGGEYGSDVDEVGELGLALLLPPQPNIVIAIKSRLPAVAVVRVFIMLPPGAAAARCAVG